MAAPKGNSFWKFRTKHGRDKIFSTPESLWEAAVEYFEFTDKRKWQKDDWVGKDAIKVKRKTETPYSLKGLFLYLDVSDRYFIDFEEALEGKNDDVSNGFSHVITRIRNIIYTQKYEGAVVGAFNANIISKELGMSEKISTDITTGGKPLPESAPPIVVNHYHTGTPIDEAENDD